MGTIIGIDLGTTNSCVAVVEAGEPRVIVNEEGHRTTPSVVAFNDSDVLVGSTARRQAVVNPEKTVYSAKRFIGCKYSEVKGAVKRVAFSVVKSESGDAHFQIGDKAYSPPEISAKVLQRLKRAAEKHLGETVTEAVVTVPAYFNDSQRQATKDAGKIAGLNVRRIINEPTAAALAYGLDTDKEQLIAVYDLGGGTFDVSILEISGDVVEVLSTSGDTHLGGDDVDNVLVDHLVAEFKSSTDADVSTDSMALQRLREAAEKAKIDLSSAFEANISLPFLTADNTGPKHLDTTITRAQFDRLVGSLVNKTFKSCRRALKDAGKSASDIDQVILVGGSTRIPLVLKKVEKFFKKTPHQGVNPDEVVALGAAVQGGVLSGDVKDMLLLDVTPLSLGIETLGGVTTKLISRNTTVPTKKTEVFSTAAPGQTQVEIHALQGEREMADDNRTLGKFTLDGIPPAPRGVPQIEVEFDIDANGILKVSAKDKSTGKDQSITIEGTGGLSDKEIDTMIREASENEDADRRKRGFVEARNKLDTLTYNAKSMIESLDDKMSDDDKQSLKSLIEEAESCLSSDDREEIDSAYDKLNACLEAVSKAMYEATMAEQPTPPPSPSEGEDDDVIDADFTG